jgi:hypothetical protein
MASFEKENGGAWDLAAGESFRAQSKEPMQDSARAGERRLETHRIPGVAYLEGL